MGRRVDLIGSPNVRQIYSLVLGLLKVTISLQRMNFKCGAWGGKGNEGASFVWRLPQFAVLCYKSHVAELQTELNCVFWSAEDLQFLLDLLGWTCYWFVKVCKAQRSPARIDLRVVFDV